MGFLHQLQLLLWKNVTLKRRSPVSEPRPPLGARRPRAQFAGALPACTYNVQARADPGRAPPETPYRAGPDASAGFRASGRGFGCALVR